MRTLGAMLGLFVLLFGCRGGRDRERSSERPPFEVRPGSGALVLVWFDAEGEFHTVTTIDEVPAERREVVRVDSTTVGPAERGDPSRIWVVDLRAPGPTGAFPVRSMRRDAFEQRARPPVKAAAASTAAEVILYRTSWCGVCRQAADFLRARGIAFVEHDVERDAEAAREMRRKVRAAGISSDGVPVLDVYGQVVQGFDPAVIDRILRSRS